QAGSSSLTADIHGLDSDGRHACIANKICYTRGGLVTTPSFVKCGKRKGDSSPTIGTVRSRSASCTFPGFVESPVVIMFAGNKERAPIPIVCHVNLKLDCPIVQWITHIRLWHPGNGIKNSNAPAVPGLPIPRSQLIVLKNGITSFISRKCRGIIVHCSAGTTPSNG